MAPTPATLVVNFISNYAGDHRICWRIGNVGPYNCTTIVTCIGGGNPCQALIPISVDNDTCSSITFEGYVQAICEAPASLNGRVPFSETFVPTPTCLKYDVTCSAVELAGFTITNPGAGYTVGSNPNISFSGGGGVGAIANCNVGDGGVKTWTITNGGAGYNGGGSAVFLAVPAVNIVGAGVGASFDVTVTLGVITGLVLVSPGTGYVITNTFEFNNANLGGSGAGAVITVDSVNTGEIESVNLVNPGSGYTSAPTALVDPPPALGTQATVTALLADCLGFDFGNDCAGNPIGIVADQPLGFVYKKCSAVAPTPGVGWNVTQTGCCYDCVQATFTVPFGNANVTYTDCTTGALTTTNVAFGVPLVVCVVNNSWYWDPNDTVNVATGVCP